MKIRFMIAVLLLAVSLPYAFAQTEQWKVSSSTHFFIYYKNAPADFIEKLTEQAEGNYDRITEELGFRRFNFWLWDNRAKIYIHDDAVSYQASTGQPAWSAGVAVPQQKTIQTFLNAQGFFDSVLPHEMAHIIFREFVGFQNNGVPRWLDEGVASYQGSMDSGTMKNIITHAIEKKSFMELEELARVNLFLTQDQEVVNLFYAEAASVVNYLMKEFGADSFVSFCQQLRDKQNLQSALASAYSFAGLQELGEKWYKYLNK